MPQIGKQFVALEVSQLKVYPLTVDSTTPGSLAYSTGMQVIATAELQVEPAMLETARWVGDAEVRAIHTILKNMKGRIVANNIPTDALDYLFSATTTQNANTQNSAAGTVTPQASWTWTVPTNPTFAIAAGTWTVTLSVVGSTYALQITNGATVYTSDYNTTVNRTYSFAGTAAGGLTIAVTASPGSPANNAAVGTFAITNTSAGATTSTTVMQVDTSGGSYFKIEALVPYFKDITQEVGANGRIVIPKCKFVGGPQLNFNGNPAQTAINWECVRPYDPNAKYWAQFIAGESAQTLTP